MNVDRRLLLCVAVAGLGACDRGSDRPADWSYIHAAIIRPSCATASCHSYQRSAGGLDLSTSAGAYSVLTGHTCDGAALPGVADHAYVDPDHPDDSQLMHLLLGDRTFVMPPDVPLPPVEVNLIRAWIYEGASCDTP
ncbi:MAG TPA: hypothetical protein VL463_23405 [Kofleriaceae bacterium]|nr:hypothetical protein [Kofleriaceae bacterium]